MTAQLLVVPPGSLSEDMRTALRERDILVIETDRAADVHLLAPSMPAIGANGLLYAALRALNTNRSYASNAREDFAETVFAEISAERERTKAEWVKLPPRDASGKFAKARGEAS